MEEDGSGGNGDNMLSPVESNLEVCSSIEIEPIMDKSYNPETKTNHTVIKTEPCQQFYTLYFNAN
ncbi:hypothetical protein NQ318_012553 [Aromia moschata]|uniref:Uncharacterized protein n=1 Tax=Aromia moschata TaxID=1265417 RepID=A0AAV8XCH0_9CUCU|nr:hypothetical protein NQ318_012553 [Aromia moschata]